MPAGRFGEPAVYVGRIAAARHLTFRAVRVIGLGEGHFPGIPREDPVVPDALRARLLVPASDACSLRPPTSADEVLAALHALDTVVRNATERVVLSVSRLDLERSQREASSVILEAAAALGRPNATTGETAPVIPDAVTLRRDAFMPGRRAALLLRHSAPLGEAGWLDGVTDGRVGIPSWWRNGLALDLGRAIALGERGQPDALDGLIGLAGQIRVPGLSPDRPISASALERLLRCPHMFLFERILGFEEPASRPALREIEQPSYGSLVHRTAESFYRVHGEAFCRRERTIDAWLQIADPLIEQAFDAFVEEYPLVGGAVRGVQRERLRRDVVDLLQYDWTTGADRRFIAVERSFGRPDAVELRVNGRSLFVRGQIDRLDVEGPLAIVRDLKTGRPHPRFGKEAQPEPMLDVQIAVYGLVTRLLARSWGLPERVGTAYVYLGRGAEERSWRADFHEMLAPTAHAWLALAADLLANGVFPRTPRESDCSYCAFRPVCGDAVFERAGQILASGDSVLQRFGALKDVELENDA
jgi:RecB family exonuclease